MEQEQSDGFDATSTPANRLASPEMGAAYAGASDADAGSAAHVGANADSKLNARTNPNA